MDFNQILPYLPYIFTGLFILAMLVSVLFALVRGMSKSRVRFIILAVCLILAFVITWAFKSGANTVYPQFEDMIEQALTSEEAKEVYQLVSGSEPMQETLIGFATALVAPLFFFIVFTALRIVTWIIYFIVMLFIGGKMKRGDEGKALRGLRTLALGILQGALIFFVLMTPVYAYVEVALPVAKTALEQEEVQNALNGGTDSEAAEQTAANTRNVYYTMCVDFGENATSILTKLGGEKITLGVNVDPAAIEQMMASTQNNFFYSMYAKLGGNLTCNFLTEFKSGGEKTNVLKEVNAISKLAVEALKLKDIKGVESLDEKTALVISGLMDNIGESKLTQTIVGEVIYAVTDAWKNDRAVLGIEKPKLDPMVDPILSAIIDDFHGDARNSTQLSADFKTLGEMVAVMAKADLFKEISGENTDPDQIIESLAKGTVIKDLISAIGKNETLKNLIPELANVGMRAIGSALLNLP